MSKLWRQMTSDECGIIQRLLSEGFPGRDAILLQLHSAQVRPVDEEGSLAFRTTSKEVAEVERRIPIEAEAVDVDGMTIHALLHVVDGRISELEIYKDDSTLVIEMPAASEWNLLQL